MSFALWTGARKNEILQLKRKDVILGELGGSAIFRDTKNGDNRRVLLTKKLVDFLREIIAQHPFAENVFAHKNGAPIKSIDVALGLPVREQVFRICGFMTFGIPSVPGWRFQVFRIRF